MTHAPACPYKGFDAAAHARTCGSCDPAELEERCACASRTVKESFVVARRGTGATLHEAIERAVED